MCILSRWQSRKAEARLGKKRAVVRSDIFRHGRALVPERRGHEHLIDRPTERPAARGKGRIVAVADARIEKSVRTPNI